MKQSLKKNNMVVQDQIRELSPGLTQGLNRGFDSGPFNSNIPSHNIVVLISEVGGARTYLFLSEEIWI